MQVFAKNIEWDTSDYNPYLVDPCDANVPDLPNEVEIEPKYPPNSNSFTSIAHFYQIQKVLEKTYGFSVIDFDLEVRPDDKEVQ